jgi:pimeloyl-ACP methyl ester carboxylesterase
LTPQLLRGPVISKILRWSAKTFLVLLLLLIAAVAVFRLTAALRETADRAALAPTSGHLVKTSSGGVFVQEKGPPDGIPVVLFHGTAAWSELWWRTSDALAAAGFRVIALDLPPFGFSDRPGSYTRRDQAARINDVLGALKAPGAIIVGHSFGAGAATELVMRYPDRARALVLVDAALGLTAPLTDAPAILQPKWIREILVSLTITNPLATKLLLRSLIAKKERAVPEYVEILQRPTSLRNSTSDIADWAYYFVGADREASSADRSAYARLKLPTAILWGDKDTVTPVEQARDLQTLLPQASLTWLPGLGHIPQIEDPTFFNEALLKALAKL